MRLWHYKMIPFLPKQQLIGQWRECCLIAKNIAERGTPGHLLVNRIMDYPKWHFMEYTLRVIKECEKRGYRIDRTRFFRWFDKWNDGTVKSNLIQLFYNWHTDRYLTQCMINLQEKYDCGGITDDDWFCLLARFAKEENTDD